MKTIAVDSSGDIYLGPDNNIAFVNAAEAVGETAVHFAKTLRGEMIHEFDLGVPFFITAFGPNVTIPQFEAAMKARIRETPDVLQILSFETVRSGDVLSYTATIETVYGRAQING